MSHLNATQHARPQPKLSTLLLPSQLTYHSYSQQNQDQCLQSIAFMRKPSNKHKTYAYESKKCLQPKYKLSQIPEKKLLILLAFIQRLQKNHDQIIKSQELEIKKKHQMRLTKLNLSGNKQVYRTIEPITKKHLQLQESMEFFVMLKQKILEMVNEALIGETKKTRANLIKKLSHEQNDQINHQKQNLFITNSNDSNSFNNTLSLSTPGQHVDLMSVSNFALNPHNSLEMPKKMNKQRFHQLSSGKIYKHFKSNKKSTLIIQNKYQTRKKEEIRLFMQLNQKTEHLQNFRSEEGKFFKFNENLKIMVKNVNVCRMVMISKKKVVIGQLEKVMMRRQKSNAIAMRNTSKDVEFDRTEKMNDLDKKEEKNKRISTKGSQQVRKREEEHEKFDDNRESHDQELNQAQLSEFNRKCNGFLEITEKPLRLEQYMKESEGLFRELEQFILIFIHESSSYLNYLKQNQIKSKLKAKFSTPSTAIDPITLTVNTLYDNFLDRLFHISELVRLYFNELNQFNYQNLNVVRDLNMVKKQQVEEENKRLIELRYVLGYLQKECENTSGSVGNLRRVESQSKIVRKTNVYGSDVGNDKNQIFNNIQNESIKNTKNKMDATVKLQKTTKLNHKLTIPLLSSQNSSTTSTLRSGSQQTLLQPASLNQTLPVFSSKSPLTKPCSPPIQHQKQVDINQIWKTFYNKKFSSTAMRLRLY